MDAITERRKRCPLCGRLLERYPSNGEPLVHGSVCLQCNARAVIPFRYFLGAYQKSPIAMLITNGRIQTHKTSDGHWKPGDIELFVGKDVVLTENAETGLTFAFVKGREEEPGDLASVARKALKAPYGPSVLAIPTRLLKGARLNE